MNNPPAAPRDPAHFRPLLAIEHELAGVICEHRLLREALVTVGRMTSQPNVRDYVSGILAVVPAIPPRARPT
jgi:hypothetical protein